MSLFSVAGKVALVTGGNGGLGFAMAMALRDAGARVAIAGRNTDKLARAKAELGADTSIHPMDLAVDSALPTLISDVVSSHGGLDILVNNAGTSIRGAPQDLTRADYEFVQSVNVTAALRLSQLAHPHLCSRGGGKIIQVGSMFSHRGSAFSLPYAVSKGAVVQLTRSLAVAWAQDNIQVNAILPGWFDTELTQGTRAHLPGLEETICKRTPAGRWGQPDDLAGTVVFLASSASDFITGVALPVDGGFSISM